MADDDRSVCDLIRTHLQMSGHQVHVAPDGSEALRLVRSSRHDALVLDINMPESDGFGVLERHHEVSHVRLPVLALTARHAAGDVRRAIDLGSRDVLAKRFTAAQLASRVARLLRGAPGPAKAASGLVLL